MYVCMYVCSTDFQVISAAANYFEPRRTELFPESQEEEEEEEENEVGEGSENKSKTICPWSEEIQNFIMTIFHILYSMTLSKDFKINLSFLNDEQQGTIYHIAYMYIYIYITSWSILYPCEASL